MRKRRNVILALAVGSWLTIACSTGSGGLGTLLFDGYESPPDLRDKPPADRQAPGNSVESPPKTGDTPPRTGDNPGTAGGGTGTGTGTGGGKDAGGGGTCPPCDQTLDCTTSGKKTPLPLKTENGQCSAGDGIALDCTGKVLSNGQQVGSWSKSGGTYTIIATISGQTLSYVCTTKTTTDPVPTGTGTTTPPTDAGPTPTDAGTKG